MLGVSNPEIDFDFENTRQSRKYSYIGLMKLIVGLGNPGLEYSHTRHNVGFLMIEALRLEWGFEGWKDSRFLGVISEGNISGEKVILLKPTTYMNRSGQSISSIIHFYKLDPKNDILVISDDIDMEFGKVRFREK